MNRIRVLFLDVDGVLNTRPGSLDRDKLDLLDGIIRATGCAVVLSSTWRKTDQQLARITAALLSLGHTLHGCTPVLEREEHGLWRAEPRWHEISQWVNASRRVTKFVILDDERSMGALAPFHVRTESTEGLTPEIVREVVRRLAS